MQRDFFLGDKWLYYKVYAGVKTADYILLEKLTPVIEELEHKKQIKKWFFIRYQDPEQHIRLRFLVDKKHNLVTIIKAMHPVFKGLMDENLVWNIQTDTYRREIERYGKSTMRFSEFLFWRDSKMILKYLELKTDFLDQDTQLLFSFLAIDSFLDSFMLSDAAKLSIMDQLQLNFKKEFDVNKIQKKQLNIKYNALYPRIKDLLCKSNHEEKREAFYIIDEKSESIRKTVLKIQKKIKIPLEDFLASHIHMMINRQYISKQRAYELMIYDNLYRYYKTLNYSKVLLM